MIAQQLGQSMVVHCDTLVEVPPTCFFARLFAAMPFCFTLLTGLIAWAGGILIVGMTAGDIPVTTAIPTRVSRVSALSATIFMIRCCCGLCPKRTKPPRLKPGLATSYEIDPSDHKRWIVHLRRGVKWHDGCDFTADDVIWNNQYRMDQKAPYFLAQQFAYSPTWLTNMKSVSKIDD